VIVSGSNLQLGSCDQDTNKLLDFRLVGQDSCHDTELEIFDCGIAVKVCNAVGDRKRPWFAMLEVNLLGHTLARFELHENDGGKFQMINKRDIGKPYCFDASRFTGGKWVTLEETPFPEVFELFSFSIQLKYTGGKVAFRAHFQLKGILSGLAAPTTIPLGGDLDLSGFSSNGPKTPNWYKSGEGLLSGQCPPNADTNTPSEWSGQKEQPASALYEIGTAWGKVNMDSGWAKRGSPTQFSDITKANGKISIKIMSGAYKGYYLGGHYDKGIGAYPFPQSGFMKWVGRVDIGLGKLVSMSGRTKGLEMVYQFSTQSFYFWSESGKYGSCSILTTFV
jgi:hypothetical protein